MKDVVGYEGLYAVTPEGEVYSYKRKRFMKPSTDSEGYLKVSLYNDNEKKNYYVHRLVGEAYIPNSEIQPQINHRDENKANNCLQNLEWCDSKYNNNYGTKIDRQKKPILQYDLDGNFIREWPSTIDVGKKVSKQINNCLKGRCKSAYGYKWFYKDDINYLG